MPEYTNILRGLSLEKFAEVFSASARKAREAYFLRHKVRKPKKLTGLPRAGAKGEERTAHLYELLREREDEEMCEEILRVFLLTKRPMLAAALDFLSIPHENGLTDSDDVKKFESLGAEDIKSLGVKLEETAGNRDDVTIYLKFMGTPNVDEVLGAA